MAISQNFPNIVPSLSLDFANVKALDPRITFTRASSATYYNANGLLESEASGEARFDHNPVTKESLGLLIEEQRTNLLLRSEEFDNAAWTKASGGVSAVLANQTISPDGQLSADLVKFVLQNDGDIGLAQGVSGLTPSATFTFSAWVKAPPGFSNKLVNLRIKRLSAGTVTVAGPLTVTLTDQWQQVSLSITLAADNTNLQVQFFAPLNAANTGATDVFIWGASLEQGAFPTSYIPTSASQVTRAADAASMTGANFSSWYNAAEGTLYGEAIASSATGVNSNGASQAVFTIFETNINAIELFRGSGSTTGRFYVGTVGAAQANIAQAGFVANLGTKMAGAYKVNDFALSVNGAAASTDTSGIVAVNATVARIGSFLAGAGFLNGHIRKISYYPVRVTNEQLSALTS